MVSNVGIIGVGEIARAIVGGLLDADTATTPAVLLSPRGARTSAELADRFENVRVCEDNQMVADDADLVIIALRRGDMQALAGLRVGADTLVINVMAGVAIEDLRRTLATYASIVRAIPLPSIRERRSVTVTSPSHPIADAFFDRLGGALPVADESAFDIFSALTGTLTSHYSYLAALTSWATGQGIDAADADRYIRGLFQGVGRAIDDTTRSLDQLADDHETPHGNNERIRTTWFTETNSGALGDALDGLLTDLRTPR